MTEPTGTYTVSPCLACIHRDAGGCYTTERALLVGTITLLLTWARDVTYGLKEMKRAPKQPPSLNIEQARLAAWKMDEVLTALSDALSQKSPT